MSWLRQNVSLSLFEDSLKLRVEMYIYYQPLLSAKRTEVPRKALFAKTPQWGFWASGNAADINSGYVFLGLPDYLWGWAWGRKKQLVPTFNKVHWRRRLLAQLRESVFSKVPPGSVLISRRSQCLPASLAKSCAEPRPD